MRPAVSLSILVLLPLFLGACSKCDTYRIWHGTQSCSDPQPK